MPQEEILPLERVHLKELKGYVPGTQPSQTAIKLNTNENPFPPSPGVIAALASVTARALQRYPDPTAKKLREAAAQLHAVHPNQIIATNGGDELLRLALTTFVDPGRAIGIITPSYGVYSVLAGIHQATLSTCSLSEDWALAAETAKRWNSDGAQLALLTNPHAPSGALFPLDTIEKLAASFRGVLLIDEAYIDFVDPTLRYNTIELTSRYPNVLLLRTLSKGYSLAGLRLAYGIGSAPLIEPMLHKTKDSYNVDTIAQVLGEAALKDQAYAFGTWEQVRKEKARVTQELQGLGFSVEPSQTNFVLATPPRDVRNSSALALKEALEQVDVFVRWFDEPRLRGKLRITIGSHDENRRLLERIQALVISA